MLVHRIETSRDRTLSLPGQTTRPSVSRLQATGTTGSGSFHPPTSSSTSTTTAPAFKPSASSRAGLAARLGSALQSWTSASGRGDGSGGGSGSATPPREGRPGPLGTKYTQQQRSSESQEPGVPRGAPRRQEDRSQLEPSAYRQLSDGQLPANPAAPRHGLADEEAVGRTGNEEDGLGGCGGSSPVAETRPCAGAAARQRGGAKGPEGQEEEEEEGLEEEGCAVSDMIELEPGNSKAEGQDLIRLEAAAPDGGETTKEAKEAPPPSPPRPGHSTATHAGFEKGQQQQQVMDGGAEAGAGTAAAAAPLSIPGEDCGTAPVEKVLGGNRGQESGQDNDGQETDDENEQQEENEDENENENENETNRSSSSSSSSSSSRGRRGRRRQGDATNEKKKSKKRVVGLWELKAERSRLEHALAEAEVERDIERSRAREAADRVEEVVERLERLRRQQRCGAGRGSGAGAAAAAAAVDIVG